MTADALNLDADAEYDLLRFLSRAGRTAQHVCERVAAKPHRCLGCQGVIPAPSVYVSVTIGGKRTKFTAHFHDACVPTECRPVPRMNPLEVWKAAKRAMRDARRPEDCPAWVWERFAPAPF